MYKLTCCVAVAMVGLGGQAVAVIINVPADQPTIQAGINAAVNGDEVVVAVGTYNEAIDFMGKAITVRSTDPLDPAVVAATVIDGTGNLHVVQCVSGEGPDTVLSGFVITGGNANEASPNDRGGGMYNDASSPTVTNCTFSGNSAHFGGGMHNESSSPTVTNCTFSGNSATSIGGGMANRFSSPTVTNCTFIGNTAGGNGGGMRNIASSPTVTNCTFSGNMAVIQGGGMKNSQSSNPTVTNCTFSGNSSGNNGGGMANGSKGNPMVTNCTFSGNSAANNGGGMYNQISSSPTVTNCTFIGNSASSGRGMFNSADSSPTVTNCILWGNSPGQIVGGAPTVTFSDVLGGFPGTGNIDADPLFVDPDNGDLRLQPRSPCIDAGDNTAVPVGITTDLDGNPRFVDDPCIPDTGIGMPPIVDMGAYEWQLDFLFDCNGNGVQDTCDILADPGLDCDGNLLIDSCEVLADPSLDCDGNGIHDACDILADPALDCDGNGLVDGCEIQGDPNLDCNSNGILDSCDIASGSSLDVNANGIPDECECLADLSGNGAVDVPDLLLLLAVWGLDPGGPPDFDGDGTVAVPDLLKLLANWGACPVP